MMCYGGELDRTVLVILSCCFLLTVGIDAYENGTLVKVNSDQDWRPLTIEASKSAENAPVKPQTTPKSNITHKIQENKSTTRQIERIPKSVRLRDEAELSPTDSRWVSSFGHKLNSSRARKDENEASQNATKTARKCKDTLSSCESDPPSRLSTDPEWTRNFIKKDRVKQVQTGESSEQIEPKIDASREKRRSDLKQTKPGKYSRVLSRKLPDVNTSEFDSHGNYFESSDIDEKKSTVPVEKSSLDEDSESTDNSNHGSKDFFDFFDDFKTAKSSDNQDPQSHEEDPQKEIEAEVKNEIEEQAVPEERKENSAAKKVKPASKKKPHKKAHKTPMKETVEKPKQEAENQPEVVEEVQKNIETKDSKKEKEVQPSTEGKISHEEKVHEEKGSEEKVEKPRIEVHQHKHFEHHHHLNMVTHEEPQVEHHQEAEQEGVELSQEHPPVEHHQVEHHSVEHHPVEHHPVEHLPSEHHHLQDDHHEPEHHELHMNHHQTHMEHHDMDHHGHKMNYPHSLPMEHQHHMIPIKEEWIAPDVIEDHNHHSPLVFEDHSELHKQPSGLSHYKQEVITHPFGTGLTPVGIRPLMGAFSNSAVSKQAPPISQGRKLQQQTQTKPKNFPGTIKNNNNFMGDNRASIFRHRKEPAGLDFYSQ